MTRWRRRVLATAALLLLLVGADRFLSATARQYDLTAEQSLSLAPETRAVVSQLRQPVRITAFLRPTDSSRAVAASLLDRYRRQNRRITWRLRDPDLAGGEIRRLGVDPVLGGLALESKGKVEQATSPSEQDITAALARIVRGRAAGVCVTSGHGEPAVEATVGEGLSALTGALRANGYKLRVLDLLVKPEVPATCNALLVANPLVSLGPAADAAVASYLAAGGRALVLLDPGSQADLSGVLKTYGIVFHRGIVLEGDADSRLGDDPLTLVVRRFNEANPSTRRLAPLLLAGAQAVSATDATGRGLTGTDLATTTPLAYLETEPAQPRFDPRTDRSGPLAVAVAADASRVIDRRRVERTRVVAVGDIDLATNAFIGEGGNGRFLVQALDWLTLDEDLVSVSANIAAYRPLNLTDARLRYARFLMAGALPAAFVIAGLLVWAVRRAR